ncbi:MAG: hypothetical protein ACREN2_01075, partial [Candidatus Dormibacteria bacterium]
FHEPRDTLLLELMRRDGPIEVLLGQQWVTHVFAYWEHYYRPAIAGAIGCDADEVRHDLFGDLRLLRHDILHARGQATRDNTGRCRRESEGVPRFVELR